MKIGLIDVDNTNFPNLVLMKLSAYYKAKGYDVELVEPSQVLEGDLFNAWDKLIGTCVFTWNMPLVERLRQTGVHVAGSGTDSKETLSHEVEHMMPDYSLYGDTSTAYGFLTRGCPRRCPFCIVAEKEGAKSVFAANLNEWWNGQKYIKLLDPNLLAYDEHMGLLDQLVESGAWVDVTQGLDARLLNDANTEKINRLKVKMLHFAWDNPRDKKVQSALARFAETNKLDFRKRRVYVLTNYWSTIEEDLMRMYWLRDNGYDPYAMVFNKEHAPKEVRRLQRWVNNKFIFRSCGRFEDYQAVKRTEVE